MDVNSGTFSNSHGNRCDFLKLSFFLKICRSLLVMDHEGKSLELKIDEFQRKNKAGDASDSQVKHITIENERHRSGKTTRLVNDICS